MFICLYIFLEAKHHPAGILPTDSISTLFSFNASEKNISINRMRGWRKI